MDNDDWNARLNTDANPVTQADLEAALERTTFKPPLKDPGNRSVIEIDVTGWSDFQIDEPARDYPSTARRAVVRQAIPSSHQHSADAGRFDTRNDSRHIGRQRVQSGPKN